MKLKSVNYIRCCGEGREGGVRVETLVTTVGDMPAHESCERLLQVLPVPLHFHVHLRAA